MKTIRRRINEQVFESKWGIIVCTFKNDVHGYNAKEHFMNDWIDMFYEFLKMI